MYPTEREKVVIEAAEKIMFETMARYDPSHDAYHGKRRALHVEINLDVSQSNASVKRHLPLRLLSPSGQTC